MRFTIMSGGHGDQTPEFDLGTAAGLAVATERFGELVADGRIPFALERADSPGRRIESLDDRQAADTEIHFLPQFMGG